MTLAHACAQLRKSSFSNLKLSFAALNEPLAGWRECQFQASLSCWDHGPPPPPNEKTNKRLIASGAPLCFFLTSPTCTLSRASEFNETTQNGVQRKSWSMLLVKLIYSGHFQGINLLCNLKNPPNQEPMTMAKPMQPKLFCVSLF